MIKGLARRAALRGLLIQDAVRHAVGAVAYRADVRALNTLRTEIRNAVGCADGSSGEERRWALRALRALGCSSMGAVRTALAERDRESFMWLVGYGQRHCSF